MIYLALPFRRQKFGKKMAESIEKVTQQVSELRTVELKSHIITDNSNKESEVVVQLADPSDALYKGISTFEDLGLNPDILKGVYGMGFQKPSKIQEKALPLLISNPPKNMIGQSQSGTGKTAAFVLSMLSRVDPSIQATQAICLAPVRELARQIMDVVREMGKYTSITTAFAIPNSVQKGDKVNATIVVGTPGTVLGLIKRRELDISKVKIFVMDEADEMLNTQGMGDDSIRIKKFLPKTCQIVLFSATFSDELREFATKFAPSANSISLKQEELSVEGIRQFYMDCKNKEHKTEVLCAIYGLLTIGQSIIFVRVRDDKDVFNRIYRNVRMQIHLDKP